MKVFKKQLFVSILSALLVLTLFSGCAEYQGQTNDSTERTDDNIDIVSYCAKDKSEENRIFFNYPKFKETVPNAEILNQLIVEFVENALQISDGEFKGNLKDAVENWEWDENEYTLIAMDISYNITRNDLSYFSVTFEGEFNHKYAAHPMNYFDSLIIDVKKCEMITLSDLYSINAEFVALVRNTFKEQIGSVIAEKIGGLPEELPEYVEEQLSSYDDTSLQEALYQSIFRSFLTDTDLGISVPFSHAMGDHFEILISYGELTEYLVGNDNQ